MTDTRMDGKVAVVTGASRGIGHAVARRLLDGGARVVLCARDPERLREATAELSAGDRVYEFAADIAVDADASRLTEFISSLGRLDYLVNSAGRPPQGTFADVSVAQWRGLVETKLLGYVRCCQLAIRLMGRGGAIVNIAGVTGAEILESGRMSSAAGAAINAGIVAFSKSLALEYEQTGIRVNVVSPGNVATDRWQVTVARVAAERGVDPAAAATALSDGIPIGRPAEPSEIAEAVIFLLSEAGSYVNGVQLFVDGGLTRRIG
jgi:NAD(P)-dependent dehydrogenase (short-subunit alcohol dehydrogenase family)